MKTYLEPCEIALLERATDNLRDRLLIRVLFHLGCRATEAIRIAVEDVDFRASTITIVHLKTRLHLSCPSCRGGLSRTSVFCPRCGDKVKDVVTKGLEHRRQRSVSIDSRTLAMLREYISRGGPVLRDGRRLIFGIGRHRAWQIVRACAQRAGLPDLVNPENGKVHHVSPHRLRHAFAVNAMKQDDSGDGMRLLQQHLGHPSFNTKARYRKVSGEEQRDWYAKLWEDEKDGDADT